MADRISEILSELRLYFVSRMIAGDFTIKSANEQTLTIMIDQYQFCLWICGSCDDLSLYDGVKNAVDIKFTTSERVVLYATLESVVRKEIIKKKQEEIRVLRNSFGLGNPEYLSEENQ